MAQHHAIFVGSHPTGVRGLKFLYWRTGPFCIPVAPHWGAWIEIRRRRERLARDRSHPTGVRGLKSIVGDENIPFTHVAPHWGAWIEIANNQKTCWTSAVAPHWGAWIEIGRHPELSPAWKVAPHWGAWIEINWHSRSSRSPLSHPTGVRGLKSMWAASR